MKEAGLNSFVQYLAKSLTVQSARESSVDLILGQISIKLEYNYCCFFI